MMIGSSITFQKLCHEELFREKERDGIGLLAEKRLHSVLKRWAYDDFSAHEQKVAGRGEKKRRFVADILTPDGEIIEIQTGDLYPLLKKIAFYMEETDHPVTVIHPLVSEKYISWMQPETGEVTERRKAPLHETPLTGLSKLKPFLPYLGSQRLSFLFPFLSLDEYRLLDGWVKNPKRRSHRYELIPLSLEGVLHLQTKEDYLALFPDGLPAEFTAKTFGKHTRLRGYALYDALAVFEGLGAIRRVGKKGRATLYARNLSDF